MKHLKIQIMLFFLSPTVVISRVKYKVWVPNIKPKFLMIQERFSWLCPFKRFHCWVLLWKYISCSVHPSSHCQENKFSFKNHFELMFERGIGEGGGGCGEGRKKVIWEREGFCPLESSDNITTHSIIVTHTCCKKRKLNSNLLYTFQMKFKLTACCPQVKWQLACCTFSWIFSLIGVCGNSLIRVFSSWIKCNAWLCSPW